MGHSNKFGNNPIKNLKKMPNDYLDYKTIYEENDDHTPHPPTPHYHISG